MILKQKIEYWTIQFLTLNDHADYVCVKIDTIRIGMVLSHFGTPNEINAETPNKLSLIKDTVQLTYTSKSCLPAYTR